MEPATSQPNTGTVIFGSSELAVDLSEALRAADPRRRVAIVTPHDSALACFSDSDDIVSVCYADDRARVVVADLLERASARVIVDLTVPLSPLVLGHAVIRHRAIADVNSGAAIDFARENRRPRAVVLSSTSAPSTIGDDTAHDRSVTTELAGEHGCWIRALLGAERAWSSVEDASVSLRILRTAPVFAGPVTSCLTDYVDSARPIRVGGFDPMVQVIHYRDLILALVAAVTRDGAGPLNIASSGVIRLTRLFALAGRFALPLPSFAACKWMNTALSVDRLKWGTVFDTRPAAEEIGFRPRWTAEEAIIG